LFLLIITYCDVEFRKKDIKIHLEPIQHDYLCKKKKNIYSKRLHDYLACVIIQILNHLQNQH